MIKNYQEYLKYLQSKKTVNYTVTAAEFTGSGDMTFTGSPITINMVEQASQTVGNELNFVPAFREVRPEMFQEFVNQQMEQFEIFQEKNQFYGLKNIFGENEDYENSGNINEALQGLYFRMRDKLSRFKELIGKENDTDETMLDTLNDLANYAQICQIVYKKKWGK